jgi:hypothetical protein
VRSPGTPWTCLFSFSTEDPDLEHAPVVPDMGTIEIRAFRTQTPRGLRVEEMTEHELKSRSGTHRLHQGRVSERSKQSGWHHVRYYNSQVTRPILIHVLVHTALRKR